MNDLLLRLWTAITLPPRNERGDVPGWVLVTVMSAGLVGVLWTFAEDELKSMLSEALNSVSD